MAGDWIKMRWNLAGDPAVKAMARALKLDTFGVVGRLHTFWGWADQHTSDGEMPHTVLDDIDDIVEKRGFGSEMVRVQWLEEIPSGGILIPKWDRHSGESAKKRCLTRARVEKLRDKNVTHETSQCNENVTQGALQCNENVTKGALQKRYQRREEKSTVPPTVPQGGQNPLASASPEHPASPPSGTPAAAASPCLCDPSDLQLIVFTLAKIFGRNRQWSSEEQHLLTEHRITLDESAIMARYYLASESDDDEKKLRSRELTTLLRNWPGKLDAARAYLAANPAASNAEPPDWLDWLKKKYEGREISIPSTFGLLPTSVKQEYWQDHKNQNPT